jgi:hypothetical protein
VLCRLIREPGTAGLFAAYLLLVTGICRSNPATPAYWPHSAAPVRAGDMRRIYGPACINRLAACSTTHLVAHDARERVPDGTSTPFAAHGACSLGAGWGGNRERWGWS